MRRRWLACPPRCSRPPAAAYFWWVRNRRERPRLAVHVADREFYLARTTAEQRQIGVKLGLIIANYSILPNAVLASASGWSAATANGSNLNRRNFDDKTPLPFNVPPQQTTLLRLNGYATFSLVAALEEGQPLPGYLESSCPAATGGGGVAESERAARCVRVTLAKGEGEHLERGAMPGQRD